MAVITGGSGSGKSEYAERLAMALEPGEKLYLATMQVWDEEGRLRVMRHREQRREKRFATREIFTDLASFVPKKTDVILLECMSNLACNEFYREEKGAFERIARGVRQVREQCRHLVIVTNEIHSDGRRYDEETERYRRLLGELNRFLGRQADLAVEVVAGIPVAINLHGPGSRAYRGT